MSHELLQSWDTQGYRWRGNDEINRSLFTTLQAVIHKRKRTKKENEEPSPVVDKPVPYDEAVKGRHSPTGLPTTGCCSLYKSRL
jgi:hypothetical protein